MSKTITTDKLIKRLLKLNHESEGEMLEDSDTNPTSKPKIPLPKKHSHLYELDDEILYVPLHAEWSQHNVVKLRNAINKEESKKRVYPTTK